MTCSSSPAAFGVALGIAMACAIGNASAAKPREIDRDSIINHAATSGEGFWLRIGHDEPYPTMGIRKVFSYALALCEARLHGERLNRLFELGAQDQDREPDSPGYGNFKWTWRDDGVTDRNAVEFCMQDATLIWLGHERWLPDDARESLRDLLTYSIEGCLRHRVPTDYTNIAILNAGNLIVLGEILDRPEAAEEGYRRLDAVCLWTWQFGTHEYCSPTYYGTDLDGLLFIEAHAGRQSAIRQARALLEFFWTDIALNWFPAGECLAGSQSRTYDYIRGLGYFDRHPWLQGWLPDPAPASTSLIHPLLGRWSPPEHLQEMNHKRMPRLVRQSWGVRSVESRTHMLYPDVTLSCSSATYGLQDMPLTVDLAGDRRMARCYFIADGREDPYGKKKYPTSTARHMKALHLRPFWTAAQRAGDVLGLVLYRREDLQSDQLINLQSHFVFRRELDASRLRGQEVTLAADTPDGPRRIDIQRGDPLVLRYGTAAVGIRLVWSRAQDGQPAAAALVDDGNPHGALRLTVDHHRPQTTAQAGAAFWVRVGSGLASDEDFLAWCRRFEEASPATVDVSQDGPRLAISGEEGPVSIGAAGAYGAGPIQLVPAPTRAALELDGEEIGRPLLASIEPVVSYAKRLDTMLPIDVPLQGHVFWEAEDGLTFPGMTTDDDPAASAGRYVWQTPDNVWSRSAGNVTWTLEVAKPGRYWLWGRVHAPNPEMDSFFVQVSSDTGETPAESESWHTGQGDRWRWQSVGLNRSKEPTPLDLPAGPVRLRFRVRETGTKIDRLFLTPDPNARPE